MTFFVCRLIARPDFATTMTEAERAVMQAHVVYWRGHLERGAVLLFGPVLDPVGVWGLAIVRVASASEVDAMTNADPVCLAGIGQYDVSPMAPGTLCAI